VNFPSIFGPRSSLPGIVTTKGKKPTTSKHSKWVHYHPVENELLTPPPRLSPTPGTQLSRAGKRILMLRKAHGGLEKSDIAKVSGPRDQNRSQNPSG
jgi:hypothetical protein